MGVGHGLLALVCTFWCLLGLFAFHITVDRDSFPGMSYELKYLCTCMIAGQLFVAILLLVWAVSHWTGRARQPITAINCTGPLD